jgi:ribA/ribD-fused uncharacterized protein
MTRSDERFRHVETEAVILPCNWCGSPAQLWQRSNANGVWSSAVMCTNQGGGSGSPQDECPLYLPPESFYHARKVEAIDYWNRWIRNRNAPPEARVGPFVVANAGSYDGQNKYRTLELGGMSGWTPRMEEALWFARRRDAERFAADDEDAWRILPVRTELLASKHHKLDTDSHVFFYEQEFYVLSNFSAFQIKLLEDDGFGGENCWTFDTSEAAYHWFKFPNAPEVQEMILRAPSAHEALKIAERWKSHRRSDWDDVKVAVMRNILREKASQHDYVRRKLLETGDRVLVEDSWRDPYWGWGPNQDGQNLLGKLWMEIRSEIRNQESPRAEVTA